jgi:hypothetical protein
MTARSIPCLACGQPVPTQSTVCPSCGTPVAAAPDPAAGDAVLSSPQSAAPQPAALAQPGAAPAAAAVAVAVAAGTEAGAGPAIGQATAAPSPVTDAPGSPAPRDPDAPGPFAARVGTIAGAYLPPSSVHRPDQGAAPPPQMPLAASPALGSPAGGDAPRYGAGEPPQATGYGAAGYQATGYASVGYGAAARPDPDLRPPEPAPAGPPARPGRVSLFADLPFDAPDSISEWLVTIGSSVAALSFLLPWAPRIVSYTSSWGLASPSHLPILALLLVTAVLAILPNRVATWIRSGVLGLIGGSLFLGILWPYVVGDFGAEFGSIVGAAAAIILAVGGIVAVAPRRQEGGEA